MIEHLQLQQLVAIAERGTLSAAAAEMHISQPALTRSMQRLEETLGVSLFDRTRNKIALNAVGELAVARSKEILLSVDALGQELAALYRSLSTLALGGCSPAPLRALAGILGERFPEKHIVSEIASESELRQGLLAGHYQLALLSEAMEEPGLLCRPYAVERLCLELPADHPLSDRESLSFADLAGLTVLAYQELGIWQSFAGGQKDIHLIRQNDWTVLEELISASGLPCFCSSWKQALLRARPDRVLIPVRGENTEISLYLCAPEDQTALLEQVAALPMP